MGDEGSQAEQFRILLDNICDYAVFEMDCERRVVTWNRGAERVLGFSETEIVGKSGDIIFTPEDRAAGAPEREVATAIEKGRAEDERWHVRKDGTRLFGSGVMNPIYRERKLKGYVKVLRDKTESRRAEEERGVAEERLRSALRAGRMATWQWNPATDEMTGSDTIADLFGLPPGVELRSSAQGLRIVHPADRAQHRALIERAGREGGTWHAEYRIIRPRDGKMAWLEERAHAAPNSNAGEIRSISGVVWDITERKRAEQALLESEQRLRTLIENVREYALYQTTLDGTVTSWNPGSERVFGYGAAEMLGDRCTRLFTMEDSDAGVAERMYERVAEGHRHEDERWMQRKNGTRFWAQCVSEPARDETGRIAGIVNILRDETERRQIDQERRRLHELERELLQQRLRTADAELDRTKDELRALAARLVTAQEDERRRIARELHDDLGQRMAALGMDIARLREAPEAHRADLLAALNESISEVGEDLRRISHRLHPDMLEHLGLEASIRELVEEFERRWPAAVDYAAHGVPDRVALPLATALYRVAQEALQNARKYAHGAPVAVLLSCDDGVLEMTVEDRGPGFDPGAKQRGLGLVAIAERVRHHGGTLTVHSRPGDGTVLVVRVPVGATG